MNMHKMKLQAKYFDFIKNGTKRIEIRLNDEKRQLIKVGDIIEFSKLPSLKDRFKVKVINLFPYHSFKDLVNDFDIALLANNLTTKDELIDILEKIYSKDQESLYGVLGIEFVLIQEN